MPHWYNKDKKFREYSEGESAKKVNKEIEDIRKGIASIAIAVVSCEEKFERMEMTKHDTDEIEKWWNTNALRKLFFVSCVCTKIENYFETNKGKGKILIEMLIEIDEIKTIKETAEEVVQNIKYCVEILGYWQINKIRAEKSFGNETLERRKLFYNEMAEYFKMMFNGENRVTITKFRKLNEHYSEFQNRTTLLR